MVEWLENGLNCCAQSIVISGLKFRWWTVTSAMFQRLKTGPTESNAFVRDLDDRTMCIPGKFAEGLVDIPDGCAVFQNNVDNLEKQQTIT